MTDRKRLTEEEVLLFLYLLGTVTDDLGQAFQEASEAVFRDDANHDSFEEKWGAPASQVYTEQTRRKHRRFVEHVCFTDVEDIAKRLAAIRAANRSTDSQNEDTDLEDALDGLIAAVSYANDVDEVDLSVVFPRAIRILARKPERTLGRSTGMFGVWYGESAVLFWTGAITRFRVRRRV